MFVYDWQNHADGVSDGLADWKKLGGMVASMNSVHVHGL